MRIPPPTSLQNSRCCFHVLVGASARTRFFGEMDDLIRLIREKRAERVSVGFLGGKTATAPSVLYSK